MLVLVLLLMLGVGGGVDIYYSVWIAFCYVLSFSSWPPLYSTAVGEGVLQILLARHDINEKLYRHPSIVLIISPHDQKSNGHDIREMALERPTVITIQIESPIDPEPQARTNQPRWV